MIKEIVQFTKALPEETFGKNLKLKEGLYMFLDVQEENGKAVLKNVDENGNLLKNDFTIYKKGNDTTPLLEECKIRTAFIDPVSSNKAWNRSIFGLSCNPFALCFKNEHYTSEKKHTEDYVRGAIKEYFKNSKKYWIGSIYKDEIEVYEKFLSENLWNFLASFKEHSNLGKKNVYIFKKTEMNSFEELYNFYLHEKIFNKDEYNEITNDGTTWGISDDLSTFTDKKTFFKHHTASFIFNTRVTGELAINVNNFLKIDIPNPIAIFIDKDELNKDVYNLYNSDGKKRFSEIIKQLFNEKKDDLQNYYLLYWTVTQKGRKFMDVDFVPKFQLQVNKEIKNIFIPNKNTDIMAERIIDTVFDLEFYISTLFYTQKNNDSEITAPILAKNYFTDKIKADKGSFISTITLNNLYKYRKAWYDYVYKSKHNSITCRIFDDLAMSSILEDIRLDDQFKHDNIIRRKLNLWFNLYTHFSQNQNRENMANKTLELQKDMHAIVENDNLHIETDAQFAFASGQLIWKILIQSKSANRTHALLEPFLQKVNPEQFKLAIAKAFDLYKHEFTLYPKKYGFDKLMSDIMGYFPDEKNMKNLLTYTLSGYFSKSIL